MRADSPCDMVHGMAKKYCTGEDEDPDGDGSGGVTDGAADDVKDLADTLLDKLQDLIAPGRTWAPEKADSALYEPFLWLGQNLAVAIFACVVVVCALTAWQGAPRLRQMGASVGWTLAAVAGMASVPGVVMLLNKAVSRAFSAAFDSDQTTLLKVIRHDLEHGADSLNPLALLLIAAALVVALAISTLIFLVRQLGILAFVCMAPLVLASLARGGDTTAVKTWAMRLLGLMFAPFALLLVTPFVSLAKGALVMDAVLLVAADVLMLRMIFHGIPYVGPKLAGAARTMVERHTDSPLAHAVVRAGAPAVYERENTPRGPRTVNTPGRAVSQDRDVLLAAYGLKQQQQPGRLTAASAVAQINDRAARTAQIAQGRQQARADAPSPGTPRPPNRPPSHPPAAPPAPSPPNNP